MDPAGICYYPMNWSIKMLTLGSKNTRIGTRPFLNEILSEIETVKSYVVVKTCIAMLFGVLLKFLAND